MPRLRLLSWNLWHGLDPYAGALMSAMQSRSESRQRRARQLEALRALKRAPWDVFCLQEVNPARSRGRKIARALGLQGESTVVNAGIKLGGLGLPPGLEEGLAIFHGEGFSDVRFRETTLSGSALELGPLILQGGERRKALCLDGALEGLRVVVANVHLHNGSDRDPAALGRKTREIERLVEWLFRGAAEQTPELVAVCGDFNGDPDSACMSALLSAGFVELSGPEPTWAPELNPLAAKSGRRARSQLAREWDSAPHVFDRIYARCARPILEVRHWLVREPGLSDHFASCVEIAF